MKQTLKYGMVVELDDPDFEGVRERVIAALADEGFGVLTEIDVKATLKKKLDVDHPRYVILGACNPPLAHQALTGEPFIGLLLPCNVVVAERPEGGTAVAALDPAAAFTLVDNDQVQPIADDVRQRMQRVLDSLGG